MVDYRAVEGVAGETKRMFMTRVQIECEEEVLWTDGVPAVCGRVAPVVERDGEHARTHVAVAASALTMLASATCTAPTPPR